jgi:hypothetical protein
MSEPRTAAGRRLLDLLEADSARPFLRDVMVSNILDVEAEAAALPAAPTRESVLDACRRAGVHLVRFRDWDEDDDGKWYRNGDEEASLAAALPANKPEPSVQAQPAGLDDLLHRVDEAIGGAPGMYVAGYGGSMIGRDHAVRVVSDALRAAYAEGASR